MTLTWHRVTKGLETYFRSIPGMIRTVWSLFFHLKRLLCPGKPSKVKKYQKSMANYQNCLNWLQFVKNMAFDLTYGVISGVLEQCRHIFWKFMYAAIKYRFLIQNRVQYFCISKGFDTPECAFHLLRTIGPPHDQLLNMPVVAVRWNIYGSPALVLEETPTAPPGCNSRWHRRRRHSLMHKSSPEITRSWQPAEK